MTKAQVEQFLNEFTCWALTQGDIQGVALVGSYARGTATETSDVDLVLLADQISPVGICGTGLGLTFLGES
jgi:predicted nucleotidyltransferase